MANKEKKVDKNITCDLSLVKEVFSWLVLFVFNSLVDKLRSVGIIFVHLGN